MDKAFNWIQAHWGKLPATPLPPKVLYILSVAFGAGLLIFGLCALVIKAANAWNSVRDLLPRRTPGERRRARRRHWFALHVKSELQRLDNLESWQDYRFTELEAEVEAEGGRRGLLFGRLRPKRDLTRERSLSRALRKSNERLILVEGEPGAGKSVALRHVARALSDRAERRKRSPNVLVPLYVNLKDLDVPANEVSHASIEEFVLNYVNRANKLDVEEFLDEEFQSGLEEGSWFFIFDSFDEIPAILSAVEPDAVVRSFAEAIADFFTGQNTCRGVVASRMFRGPQSLSWPKFRVLRLTARRQSELVKRFDLDQTDRELLISSIHTASSDVQAMASNPMFLGLLCEHVKERHDFPQHSHVVFESYFRRRLSRDEHRIATKYGLDQAILLETAKDAAFAMTASNAIGLSPSRAQLHDAMLALSISVPTDFAVRLDALEYLKLARSEAESAHGGERPFTFAHRRFQEYFATLRVLESDRGVASTTLLTDGRWRETAVVILQTQSGVTVSEILDCARDLLRRKDDSDSGVPGPGVIIGAKLHILGILQDAYSGRAEELSIETRELAARIVTQAFSEGTLADQKTAIEYAGSIPHKVLESLIDSAFSSYSRWLEDTAFIQLGRLVSISERMRTQLLKLLRARALSNSLSEQRHSFRAQLQRLPQSAEYISFLTLGVAAPRIDKINHAAVFLICLSVLLYFPRSIGFEVAYTIILGACLLLSLLLASSGYALMPLVQYRFGIGPLFFVPLVPPNISLIRLLTSFPGEHLTHLHSRAGFHALPIIYLMVVLWLMLWAPLAIQGGVYRPRLSIIAWPIAPALYVVDVARRTGLDFIYRMTLLLGGTGALVGVILLAVWFLPPWMKTILLATAIAFSGFGFLILGGRTVISGFSYARSRVGIYGIANDITHAELPGTLARWKSYRTQAALLEHLRTQGLVVPSPESFEYFCGLATAVDNKVSGYGQDSPLDRLIGNIPFSFAEAERKGGSLTALYVFRDEVYRIREQISGALQGVVEARDKLSRSIAEPTHAPD